MSKDKEKPPEPLDFFIWTVARNATSSDADGKDENLVFVAGAIRKVGSRTLRELFLPD